MHILILKIEKSSNISSFPLWSMETDHQQVLLRAPL